MKKYDTRTARNGDIAEHMVVLHFLQQGYEVFPNAGCTGPIDIVVVDPETGETMLFDVKSKDSWERNKTTGEFNNWKVKPTPLQVGLGVRFVYVERSSGTICVDNVS